MAIDNPYYVPNNIFLDVAKSFNCDPVKMQNEFSRLGYVYPDHKVTERLNTLTAKGLIPLESGNYVPQSTVLKSVSTLYDETGEVKLQWLKSDIPKETFLNDLQTAVTEIASQMPSIHPIDPPDHHLNSDLLNLVISTDVHMGLFATADDSAEDWDTDKMVDRLRSAYTYLFDAMPPASSAIIVDLGDTLESPDDFNRTRKSGNPLDVSGKHARNLRAVYESFIFAIELALQTHETVYFYNIQGNHEDAAASAIREVIRMAFRDNPRVIVDESAQFIKYHQHGKVLLQFFHGDLMKPKQAGEAMAVDCQDIFSDTQFRFSHGGHLHSDKVYDGAISKVESHRHLAPSNTWAHSMGMRRGNGTMKTITYHADQGEVSRLTFNVT